MVHTLMARIAEPIFADCRIRIYNHTITYSATIVNNCIRIDYAVVSNLHTSTNGNTGINYTAVPNLRIIGYGHEIMNMAVCTNFRTIGNYSTWADPHLFMFPMAV